jgi:phosphatidate cytidylyltransferase
VLKTRLITALVLAAIFVPAMIFGPPELWGLLSLLALSIAVYEWCQLLPSKFSAAAPMAALTGGIGIAWMLLAHAFPGQTLSGFSRFMCVISVSFWVVFGSIALAKRKPMPGGPVTAMLAGLICWLALLELRRAGPVVIFSCLSVVVFADIAAYFFGKGFGRRKLAPQISPGKSWEGAIGGAFTIVVLALTTAAIPGLEASIAYRTVAAWSGFGAAFFLVVVVALSIMGDLHESLLKRAAGVKDSGKILPGHGGVFDRVDALIPAMPAAYLLWSLSI